MGVQVGVVSAGAAVLTGIVESGISVLADPAQNQLDPAERLDSVLVVLHSA